tara:strand:+ start:97 stop:306 length:210 start_codon:yes stop_codon:yes gene_type:complete
VPKQGPAYPENMRIEEVVFGTSLADEEIGKEKKNRPPGRYQRLDLFILSSQVHEMKDPQVIAVRHPLVF